MSFQRLRGGENINTKIVATIWDILTILFDLWGQLLKIKNRRVALKSD
jgi:hypothetical protein